MRFQFRLQSVLNLRKHERDTIEQSVAIARDRYTTCLAERDRLAVDRSAVLAELRSMNDRKQWRLIHVVDRQRHANQLVRDLEQADTAVVAAANDLDGRIKQLIIALQAVKSLEKLLERQFAEFQSREFQSATREFNEAQSEGLKVGTRAE